VRGGRRAQQGGRSKASPGECEAQGGDHHFDAAVGGDDARDMALDQLFGDLCAAVLHNGEHRRVGIGSQNFGEGLHQAFNSAGFGLLEWEQNEVWPPAGRGFALQILQGEFRGPFRQRLAQGLDQQVCLMVKDHAAVAFGLLQV
jgi:hypothetical protein